MSELYPSIAQCAIVATAFKVLLFPAYKSTDFEVHRNWLALTHSLPTQEWYFEKTSEWTLDYPPFFAYFEWALSQAAAYIEPGLLNVKALGYDSWQTVYFQRTTVILTELVLVYALHLYVKGSQSKTTAHAAALSVLLSPGLLIIDHIHFQYNGFLYGILILSLVLARSNSTLLLSGLLFAALLCFKHIYLYLAPAYFIYLLRAYCLGQRSSFPYFSIRFFNCVKLGVGIISVFAAAFGPFAAWGQLPQVFTRLFPFSRGLCHAYWAPNFWALYSFTDRVAPYLGLAVNKEAINSVTRGLVGDTAFAVLPDVAPRTCFILTVVFQLPFLARLLARPTWDGFVGAVTLCGYASFLFGWHVHEKAILLVIIPFSLIALKDRRYFGAFRPLAVAGHVSLFPLLFTAPEFPIKTAYTICWLILFLLAFDRLAPASPHPRVFLLDRFSLVYIALSIPLIAYCSLFHGIVFGKRYEFLPLMFTSSYSAIGVTRRTAIKTRLGSIFGTTSACDDFLLDLRWASVELFSASSALHRPHCPPPSRKGTGIGYIQRGNAPATPPSVATRPTDIAGAPDDLGSRYTRWSSISASPSNSSLTHPLSTATLRGNLHRLREVPQQKSFTCESTGHSFLTFFDARESEMEVSKEIDSTFPEGLRSRVLEFVQFQNTARMDDLVNIVFDHFREHFMEGDRVSIEQEGKSRYGTISRIQDMSVTHNNVFTGQSPDDQFRSFTYVLTMEDGGEIISRYKASELSRDRRIYSKLALKQFLRSTVSRDAWNGAPWMVKDHLAKRYNISTKVPEAKTRDAVMAAKKAANNMGPNNGVYPNHPNMPKGMNAMRPPLNGQHLPRGPGLENGQTTFVNFSGSAQVLQHANGRPMMPPPLNGYPRPPPSFTNMPPINGRLPPLPFPHFEPGHLNSTANMAHHTGPQGVSISLPFNPNFMQYQALAPPTLPQPQTFPPPKAFEPIKYPIDDLRIKQPRVNTTRPPIKFFSDDVPEGAEPPEKKFGIAMKSVGPLLCCWETLNVHDTIYTLDSFTFDDFVDAICFSSEEVECELLVEVHCSVLKQIITESGKIEARLPLVEEAEDSEDEESKETTPEPEPEPPARATRSSLRRSGLSNVRQRTPTPEPPKQVHQATEFLEDFNWIEQCKIRNFREGGWQAILVGLIYALSHSPVHKDACDQILAELVPAEEDATVENISKRYTYLDVNLRILALEMALQLTVDTPTFRDQLVAASQEMTRLRKEKIDYQRKRKELADELFRLDTDRKILEPLGTGPSPTDAKDSQDVSMTGTDEAKEETEEAAESTEEPQTGNRKTRHTKTQKRKREADAAKKEKAKKAKAEAAKTKQQLEYEKILTDIERKKEELKSCEASIDEMDDDLRETLVHRSKIIGKDRFLNKYYWFEHNGMPFAGVPNSSTADYGYANGRIWVQGPDEYEFQPNLEEPALSQDLEEFGFTIPQRKEKEEGTTHLSTSNEWGYYDDPSDIEKLMTWLDERGLREKAFKKELSAFRGRIAEYMVKMKEHTSVPEKAQSEDEEESPPRISTRTKAQVDKETTKDRCVLWTNSIMRAENGFNHSEEYEPPRKSKKGTATKVGKGKGRK
ncbi:glycosyltransferase family 57 protein [Amniculicola lignicola CBS 123094]|uniref:Glycosyltransferase family 57 protein n=1 Tax=Amniculicola lignicola CBS 123094 TaxID=1392246 RepID=A0A6A5WQW3_9PLEO|nr:glycosyltransferase family 57 protein [Amniculicola lignicola CBS 123094]